MATTRRNHGSRTARATTRRDTEGTAARRTAPPPPQDSVGRWHSTTGLVLQWQRDAQHGYVVSLYLHGDGDTTRSRPDLRLRVDARHPARAIGMRRGGAPRAFLRAHLQRVESAGRIELWLRDMHADGVSFEATCLDVFTRATPHD